MSRRLLGRQVDPLKVRWHNDLPMARRCGPCDRCCRTMEIKNEYLQKPLGAACVHLGEEGCGCKLFGAPARPGVCLAFACNWLRGEGTIHQRPDRMRAMPTLSADRSQLVLYLDHGLTPDTMTREARNYMRYWHRKRKTAVLLLHGDGYATTTAIWPDGASVVVPTHVDRGPEAPAAAPEPADG